MDALSTVHSIIVALAATLDEMRKACEQGMVHDMKKAQSVKKLNSIASTLNSKFSKPHRPEEVLVLSSEQEHSEESSQQKRKPSHSKNREAEDEASDNEQSEYLSNQSKEQTQKEKPAQSLKKRGRPPKKVVIDGKQTQKKVLKPESSKPISSPYFLFMSKVEQEFRQANPGKPWTSQNRAIAKREWKNMKPQTKALYKKEFLEMTGNETNELSMSEPQRKLKKPKSSMYIASEQIPNRVEPPSEEQYIEQVQN